MNDIYFEKIRLMFKDDRTITLSGYFQVEFKFNSIIIYEFEFWETETDYVPHVKRTLCYAFPDQVKAFVIS